MSRPISFDRKRLVRLVKAGWTDIEAAQEVGCSAALAGLVRRKAKVKPNRKRVYTQKKVDWELVDQMMACLNGIDEIVSVVGCHRSTILSYLRRKYRTAGPFDETAEPGIRIDYNGRLQAWFREVGADTPELKQIAARAALKEYKRFLVATGG